MSAQVFERLFGSEWRKSLREISWQAQHDANYRRKRTNQRLKHRTKGEQQ